MRGAEGPVELQVSRWLAKSAGDLAAAEALSRADGFHADHICFLAQQAAEKAVKAALLAAGDDLPRTHDLGYLLDLLGESEPTLAAALRPTEELTPYAVQLRYPNDLPPVTPRDADAALRLARAALAEVGRHFARG
jgi:HEPN domain-containing protein